jgi:catechol 2,3-dioxygenase-like lactoylglutathione lyase family enzyme
MAAMALLGVLVFGIARTGDAQSAPESEKNASGKVLGIAFETVQVSNLERSIEYYTAIGFRLVSEAPAPWIKDDAANRLYRTPGAISRTATLTIAGTSSGRPFTLYLREYKGMERSGRVDFPARHPSSPHFGLIVPEADDLWEKMRSAGILRPLSWEGKLIRMPGQTSGGIAYVRDPDGFNVEIVGIRPEAPGGAAKSNNPTLHHLGHVVMNSDKAKAFYGDLLGGKFPETNPEWVGGDNYDAVVGGRGYTIRLINGNFPQAGAPQASIPLELVEYQKPNLNEVDDYAYSDIAVSCAGFQVEGLDTLYGRLKDAGIETWSEGGIVQREDKSRAVVVRDPDVGAFVELFEKP